MHAAEALCRSVHEGDLIYILMGFVLLPHKVPEMDGMVSSMLRSRALGLSVKSEVFADRGYQSDGTLVPRGRPGAMITDEEEAIARVIRMAREGVVRSVDGVDVPLTADSVCVHGDGEKALAFVRRIRAALTDEGIEVRAL